MCRLCDEEKLYALYQAHVRAEAGKAATARENLPPRDMVKRSAPVKRKQQA